MSASRWPSPLIFLVLAATASAQQGQQGEPHIGYIYPAGGLQGTTFQAILGGRYLNATSVYFSGSGVSATIVRQDRQVTPQEQDDLRKMLSAIQEGRRSGQRLTPDDMHQAEEIRQKLARFGRRLTNPALSEFITIQVTIAPNAGMGNREIRLGTSGGYSNPLVFQVGDLPETTKPDWKNVPKDRGGMDPDLDPKPPVKNISLPTVVNGQIPPGGHDRYRFAAKTGQQVVVAVRARELIPYISDAVPGWFKATVSITDSGGEELICSDDLPFLSDPTLVFRAPADGEYVLHINDALFRGREDFIYRIVVGDLSHLPPRADLSGVAPAVSGRLPELQEKEPNDDLPNSQPVTPPFLIKGRIDPPGDFDVFRFDGKAGEKIVAEVYARRLDSPVDSMIFITDEAGRQLAFNDDHEDKGTGLSTHHSDSYLAFTIPSTGRYFVHLGDTQRGGGEAYGYRLRLSAPMPDFELRATPSSLNVRGGASVPVTLHVLRKDGFTGAIEMSLKDAAEGITLSGARVQENQDTVRFTLNAVPPTRMEPFNVVIEGRATIDGQAVDRTTVPADDVMQSFAYHHLVPAQEQKVSIIGRYRPGFGARILTATPIRIPAGGTAVVRVIMPAGPMITNLNYELSEPPEGISIKTVNAGAGPSEIVLQSDKAKTKPGTYGNLIITASAPAPVEPGTPTPPGIVRRLKLGALPAIPFEIDSR